MPVAFISFARLLLLHNDSQDPSFECWYVDTLNISFKSCLELFKGLLFIAVITSIIPFKMTYSR